MNEKDMVRINRVVKGWSLRFGDDDFSVMMNEQQYKNILKAVFAIVGVDSRCSFDPSWMDYVHDRGQFAKKESSWADYVFDREPVAKKELCDCLEEGCEFGSGNCHICGKAACDAPEGCEEPDPVYQFIKPAGCPCGCQDPELPIEA